ncbi:CD59B glycoprotein-like [Clarias gariepinus]|uniref:CD59B glycoprotein-like n=1 Tax=Clarias gariepinus TaxID=13013 RepID=UPI00234E1E32|nr:CD59B glycoprotein-like [Clarias gariepinus]
MKSLVALVFIYMFLPKAEPLRCYTCDPTNCVEYRTQTCSGFSNTCLNVTGTVSGQRFVLKTCAPSDMCNQVLPLFLGVTVEYGKCCQADLCNGAERFTLSLLLMIVPMLSFFRFP